MESKFNFYDGIKIVEEKIIVSKWMQFETEKSDYKNYLKQWRKGLQPIK